MSKRSEKMYKNSPKIERDEETGSLGITRGEKKSAEVNSGTDGQGVKEEGPEGIPPEARHAIERREVHNRHETEHMVHDHGKLNKAEMHKRHQDEVKAMHKKHEKEHGKRDSGEKEIKKIEKADKSDE